MNDEITLPDAPEMMSRLRSVLDEPHAVAKLYPKITRHAGERKNRDGIELMLTLAICDYTENLPDVVATGLRMMLPAFAAALGTGSAA